MINMCKYAWRLFLEGILLYNIRLYVSVALPLVAVELVVFFIQLKSYTGGLYTCSSDLQ